MRFHRSDVLKRHRTVHNDAPTKQRKPRRDVLPNTDYLLSPGDLERLSDEFPNEILHTEEAAQVSSTGHVNVNLDPATVSTTIENASFSCHGGLNVANMGMELETLSNDPLVSFHLQPEAGVTHTPCLGDKNWKFGGWETDFRSEVPSPNFHPQVEFESYAEDPIANAPYVTIEVPASATDDYLSLFKQKYLPRRPFIHLSRFDENSLHPCL